MKLQVFVYAAVAIASLMGPADATCGTIQKMLAQYGCGPTTTAPDNLPRPLPRALSEELSTVLPEEALLVTNSCGSIQKMLAQYGCGQVA
ncbi:MAG: hypothetical protein J3Q66DRAFT_353980 [Benniella sp.]|nr:MAG: hypothetical protein J3Q66DRAFT_353980 [Benniella sp.]